MKGFLLNHRGTGEIPKKVSEVISTPCQRKNKQSVKVAIDLIKQYLKEETNHQARATLAEAGLLLNRILISRS
jgi:hypothetical protein